MTGDEPGDEPGDELTGYRTSITIPPNWLADIAAYQKREGISARAEAIRRIMIAGMRSLGIREIV